MRMNPAARLSATCAIIAVLGVGAWARQKPCLTASIDKISSERKNQVSHLTSVQGVYDAFAKGDIPAALGFLSSDFAHVWKVREGKAVRFVQYVDTLIVQRALQP